MEAPNRPATRGSSEDVSTVALASVRAPYQRVEDLVVPFLPVVVFREARASGVTGNIIARRFMNSPYKRMFTDNIVG